MMGRFALLAALLLLAPPVAAQEFSVTINGTPSAQEVRAGGGAAYTLNVTLQGQGFECAQPVTKPVFVNLTSSLDPGAPSGASISVTNGTADYTIPEGAHRSETSPLPGGGPYSQSQDISAGFSTGSGVKQNYTATLTVTADFPGGPTGGNCNPNELPAASTSQDISLTVNRDQQPQPSPPEDDGTTPPPSNDSGTNTQGNTTDGGDNGIPIPWHVAPIALAAAALAVRRRS